MTMHITRILFATDFSDCANLAQAHAAFVAKAYGAELDVVHVLELYPGMDPEYPVNQVYLDQIRKDTDRQLNEMVNAFVHNGLTVKDHQVIGMPGQQITQLADILDADLIVLGTHGRTGLDHLLLGSTAERVVASAPCPVLAVRLGKTQDAQNRGPLKLQRILAPVDFSECSLSALDHAVQVSARFGGSLTILHVLEPVSYGLDFTMSCAEERDRIKERVEARLTRLVEVATAEGVSTRYQIHGAAGRWNSSDCRGRSARSYCHGHAWPARTLSPGQWKCRRSRVASRVLPRIDGKKKTRTSRQPHVFAKGEDVYEKAQDS